MDEKYYNQQLSDISERLTSQDILDVTGLPNTLWKIL